MSWHFQSSYHKFDHKYNDNCINYHFIYKYKCDFVQYLLFLCYNVPNFVDNLTRNHYNFYCDVTEIYVSIYVFLFADVDILRKIYVLA